MARISVSPTIADLKAERQALIDWLIPARHQPVHSYLSDSDAAVSYSIPRSPAAWTRRATLACGTGSGGYDLGGTAHIYYEVKRRTGRMNWIDTRILENAAPC